MNYSFLTLILALALSPIPSFGRGNFSTNDPCFQSAIADTYREFPLHKKVTANFFEWFSGTSSGWQTFSGIENLGVTDARYAPLEEVSHRIRTNLFMPSDAGRVRNLLGEIQGKRLIAMTFRFSDQDDLLRYFSVKSEGSGSCEVHHIDTQIDDYDNG